jgi:hypothetical protein
VAVDIERDDGFAAEHRQAIDRGSRLDARQRPDARQQTLVVVQDRRVRLVSPLGSLDLERAGLQIEARKFEPC